MRAPERIESVLSRLKASFDGQKGALLSISESSLRRSLDFMKGNLRLKESCVRLPRCKTRLSLVEKEGGEGEEDVAVGDGAGGRGGPGAGVDKVDGLPADLLLALDAALGGDDAVVVLAPVRLHLARLQKYDFAK